MMDSLTTKRYKGGGLDMLVARVSILRATNIITESPLFLVRVGTRTEQFSDDDYFSPGDYSGAHQIFDHYNNLSAEQQKKFNSLHFKEKPKDDLEAEKGDRRRHALTRDEWECLSRVRINGFDLGKRGALPGDETSFVVFETISSINHSCKPNAVWTWDPVLEQGVVHALMEIPDNTEITVNYFATVQDLLKPDEDRFDHLEEVWDSNSACDFCYSNQDSERLRREALRLYLKLSKSSWPGEGENQDGSDVDDESATIGEGITSGASSTGAESVAIKEEDVGAEESDMDAETSTVSSGAAGRSRAQCSLDATHHKHMEIQQTLQSVLKLFKKLHIKGPELANLYHHLAQYHTKFFAMSNKDDTDTKCKECKLLIHAREHFDKVCDAYGQVIRIAITCYGGDYPEVNKYMAEHNAFEVQRPPCSSPNPY